MKLYMFRSVPVSIISEFFTVHAACEQDQDGTSSVLILQLSANLYDIYHCCVYSEKLLMMYRGIVRSM